MLTQIEADRLLKLEKIKIDDREWSIPESGDKISIPLISVDRREKFLFDASSGRLSLAKFKLQTRARETIILCRLDIGGKHRNPDGEEIDSPHLHLYREGFDDKWAFSVPDSFRDLNDKWQVLTDFMSYCHVTDIPNFKKGLFV